MVTIMLAILGFIGATCLILSFRNVSLHYRLVYVGILGFLVLGTILKSVPSLSDTIVRNVIDGFFGMML